MKILAITQARFSSTRLPGKILFPLGTTNVLGLHLKRIRSSKYLTDFIVATTHEAESDLIKKTSEEFGFQIFHGDLNDVLDRFYQASKSLRPNYIVRLTSDCPLIDAEYIDDLIEKFLREKADYASNCIDPTLPDGMDAEIFSFHALEIAWHEAMKKSEREHVTPFIRESGKFKVLSLTYPLKRGDVRMTLDTKEDYEVLNKLVNACGEDKKLSDYLSYLDSHKEISDINSQHRRNEGYKKSLQGDS